MSRLGSRNLARAWVLGAVASLLAACNSILGITPGSGMGGSPTSGTTTGSTTTTHGTGGLGGSVTAVDAGDAGDAMAEMDAGDAGNAGDAMMEAGPLHCDGTDPGGTDGQNAAWTLHAFGAVGLGAGFGTGGNVLLSGVYYGNNTVFGSAPLPVPDGGQFWSDVFLASYQGSGAYQNAEAFVGPGSTAILGENTPINTALHMAVDAQGRIAVAGNFEGSFTIGGTTLTSQVQPADAGGDSLDGFVAFFDANWNPIWTPKVLGSIFEDSANAVAIDSQGNVVVLLVSAVDPTVTNQIAYGCGTYTPTTGQYADQVTITKIQPSGACAWYQSFAVANGFMDDNNIGAGLALAVDKNDDVVFAGSAVPANSIIGTGLLGNDAYNFHPFAAKLRGADGTVAWAHAYEDPNNNPNYNSQFFTAVATDPCGNIVAGGGYVGGATFSTSLGSLPSLVDTSDSGPSGGQQGVIVELDPSGTPIWQVPFTGAEWAGVTAIAVNHASDIAVTGGLGEIVGSTPVSFLDASLPPINPANGENDFYIAKLKGNGTLRWAKRYGGTPDGGTVSNFTFAIALDDEGHLVTTGNVQSPITFGPGVIVTPAGQDFFAVQLGP